jgi:hypothetical protein
MPKFSDYRDELRMIQTAAKEDGCELNFFQGTWGAKEVAAFLGLKVGTVLNRDAGLRELPVIRLGESNGEKRSKKMIRYLPADVIAHREKLYAQAVGRTPQAHLRLLRKERAG